MTRSPPRRKPGVRHATTYAIEVLGFDRHGEARRHSSGCVSRYSAGRIVDDGLHAGWFDKIAASYCSALDHCVDALERGTP